MKNGILFSVIALLFSFLLTGCSNYSKTYKPSDVKMFKFQKGTGYKLTKTITDITKVNAVWNIVQNMKKDKSYQLPANPTQPRLCFDFSSSKKPKYNCFDIDTQNNHLVLTEINGDASRNSFKLSQTESTKLNKIYK